MQCDRLIRANAGKTQSVLIGKLHADRFSNLYILLRINQHSSFLIDFENLNHMTVTARHKHELSVRRDGEIARMGSCGLETYLCEQPRFLIYSQYRDALIS